MIVIASSIWDSPLITQLAIFGATAAAVWWLLDFFAGHKPPPKSTWLSSASPIRVGLICCAKTRAIGRR